MKNNPAKKYFRALLKEKVRQAADKGKKYKPARIRKPPISKNIQREYTKQLDGMVKYLGTLYKEHVFPKLQGIVDKAQAHKKDSFRNDTSADDVDAMMNNVQIQFQQKYNKPEKSSIARNIGTKIDKFSKGVFEKESKALVGTNVFVSEPWLEEKMSAFVKENVDLVSKWSDGLKSQAEEIIMRGARTGTNVKDIESELKDRIGVVGSRYDVIARDQVNKFNAQLSQTRHEAIGIDKYIWDTSQDERVRPNHAALNGESFSYDDPPMGGGTSDDDEGNPGDGINCRCSAIPDVSDIVGELSDEIDEEDQEDFDAESEEEGDDEE